MHGLAMVPMLFGTHSSLEQPPTTHFASPIGSGGEAGSGVGSVDTGPGSTGPGSTGPGSTGTGSAGPGWTGSVCDVDGPHAIAANEAKENKRIEERIGEDNARSKPTLRTVATTAGSMDLDTVSHRQRYCAFARQLFPLRCSAAEHEVGTERTAPSPIEPERSYGSALGEN